MKAMILKILRAMGYVVLHEPVFTDLQSRAHEANIEHQRLAALEEENRHLAQRLADIENHAIDRAEYTSTNLDVTERQFQAVVPMLAERRNELLKIPFVRDYLATQRHRHLVDSRAIQYAAFDQSQVLINTVPYNQGALDHFLSLDRIRILFGVINSISELGRNPYERKILLIGPRSETELYSAMATGFAQQNVTALDLFSYSPLVTPGDMHAMPFADNSFDIVFITCVMSYSKNVPKVVSEVLRVLYDGGYVAFVEPMHYDFLPEAHKNDVPKPYDKALDLEIAPAYYGCVDDVLKLFGESVSNVHFRSDPTPPYDGWGLMLSTIFKTKKLPVPAAAAADA